MELSSVLAGVIICAVFVVGMFIGSRFNFKGRKLMDLTPTEKPHRSLTPKTDLPEVDDGRFARLLAEVNTMDEFRNRHSGRVKVRK